eukprot:2831819-Pleurochrysis_carterae.AAC.3
MVLKCDADGGPNPQPQPPQQIHTGHAMQIAKRNLLDDVDSRTRIVRPSLPLRRQTSKYLRTPSLSCRCYAFFRPVASATQSVESRLHPQLLVALAVLAQCKQCKSRLVLDLLP